MAVVHRTYLLDTNEFHKQLRLILFRNDTFSPEPLHEFAQQIIASRSPLMAEALELMRFDEDWLERSETPYENIARWYLIVLTAFLKPNHDLNGGDIREFGTLQFILKTIAWPETQVHRIIHGQNFIALFKTLWDGKSNSFDTLPKDELDALWQSGVGYLNPDEAGELLKRIENCGQGFSKDSWKLCVAMKWNDFRLGFRNPANPRLRMQSTYNSIVKILANAKESKLDLIIIMD